MTIKNARFDLKKFGPKATSRTALVAPATKNGVTSNKNCFLEFEDREKICVIYHQNIFNVSVGALRTIE